MKFSRNPESGILECYTDDGVFIGNVYTSEPVMGLTTDSDTVDGGAGSGNFGHAGRAGKVGGSAPSGGGGGSSGSGNGANPSSVVYCGYASKEEYSKAISKAQHDYKEARERISAEKQQKIKEAQEQLNLKKYPDWILNADSAEERQELVDEWKVMLNRLKDWQIEFDAEEQDSIAEYFNGAPAVFDPKYEYKKLETAHSPVAGEENKIVNPDNSKENCQRCSIAEELRYRGYDVKAASTGDDSLGYISAMKSCFVNPETVEFDSSHYGRYNEDAQKQMLKWGDGSRAMLNYVTPNMAHSVMLINEGGTIKHVDAQDGTIFTDKDYKKDTGRTYVGIPRSSFYTTLVRTDNAQLTIRVKEYCESR